jgi:hypothetical protein
MTELVEPTDLKFDLPRLKTDMDSILSRYQLRSCQLGLVHSSKAKTAEEKVYDCMGPLWDKKTNSFRRREEEYTIFNDEFKSTYFYEVYQRVLSWSKLKVGRVRFLSRSPGDCYPVHKDFDLKYHLALTTNPGAHLLFEDKRIYHIPEDGILYYLDSRPPHTSLNAGNCDRIHLVFNTFE